MGFHTAANALDTLTARERPNRSHQVMVRCTPDERKQLEEFAKAHDFKTVAALLRRAVADYMIRTLKKETAK